MAVLEIWWMPLWFIWFFHVLIKTIFKLYITILCITDTNSVPDPPIDMDLQPDPASPADLSAKESCIELPKSFYTVHSTDKVMQDDSSLLLPKILDKRSEGGRDWKYRPPPRGLTSKEYSICPRYLVTALSLLLLVFNLLLYSGKML